MQLREVVTPSLADFAIATAAFAAAVTAAITLWALAHNSPSIPRASYLDVVILVCLAVGVYRRVYLCGVLLLIYFLFLGAYHAARSAEIIEPLNLGRLFVTASAVVSIKLYPRKGDAT